VVGVEFQEVEEGFWVIVNTVVFTNTTSRATTRGLASHADHPTALGPMSQILHDLLIPSEPTAVNERWWV
jgi:hypothetical protein